MLIKDHKGGNLKFLMEVTLKQNISITFSDALGYIDLLPNGKKIIFIDPIVLAKQPSLLSFESDNEDIFLVPVGLHESTKSIESLTGILDVLLQNGLGRRGDTICAIGGGALLDTVSFAASIYRRGVHVVKIPTTLLGIVDAAIGIKTGINYLGQRNRLGSYYLDYSTVIDPHFMDGLSASLVRQGLGEIFKIAVIKSNELFERLLFEKDNLEKVEFYRTESGIDILVRAIELMLEELHDNPREKNLKRCVDFGHSFSPFVEMKSIEGVGFRALPHGFAVAHDCLLTSLISRRRSILPEPEFQKIFDLFTDFDFDFANEIYCDETLLWGSFLEMVKHRGGSQNFPIPIRIGAYDFIQDLSFEEMNLALVELQNMVSR